MAIDAPWEKICAEYDILAHDFAAAPFILHGDQIKAACQDFKRTSEKEVRILCKRDTRESLPRILRDNDLFILPVKNGEYAIVQGEGYVDIPAIESAPIPYRSKLPFKLETSKIGDSEMQHLDFAYATSLIRSYLGDESLVLTVRGRKRTPGFSLVAGAHRNRLDIKSVQTEVDAGYEGADQVVLVEAKNTRKAAADNIIIRQLYFPYRQWRKNTAKPVHLLFFRRQGVHYGIWRFVFDELEEYNSIRCADSARFVIND